MVEAIDFFSFSKELEAQKEALQARKSPNISGSVPSSPVLDSQDYEIVTSSLGIISVFLAGRKNHAYSTNVHAH